MMLGTPFSRVVRVILLALVVSSIAWGQVIPASAASTVYLYPTITFPTNDESVYPVTVCFHTEGASSPCIDVISPDHTEIPVSLEPGDYLITAATSSNNYYAIPLTTSVAFRQSSLSLTIPFISVTALHDVRASSETAKVGDEITFIARGIFSGPAGASASIGVTLPAGFTLNNVSSDCAVEQSNRREPCTQAIEAGPNGAAFTLEQYSTQDVTLTYTGIVAPDASGTDFTMSATVTIDAWGETQTGTATTLIDAIPTPEPATPSPEPTATAMPSPTPSPTPEPTATATPAPEPTATVAPSPTPEPTATATAEPTATPEQTATSEPTATVTPQPTAISSPEPTATQEPTATTTPEPTATVEPTPTSVPEPTATVQPTATAVPSPTPEPTPQPTATSEPTSTPEPTATATPEPTATVTPQPTATAIPSPTPEPTATTEPTATSQPTVEPTATLDPTPLPTVEPTATLTPTIIPIPTATVVETEVAAPTIAPEPTPPPVATPIVPGIPTHAPTQALEPTSVPTEVPAPLPTQPSVPEETIPSPPPLAGGGEPLPPSEPSTTSRARFDISTFDGNPIPSTARLCLEGQGDVICQQLAPSISSWAAPKAVVSIEWLDDSSAIVVIENLLPGDYVLRLTGMAPYADTSMTVTVGADDMLMQPVMAAIAPASSTSTSSDQYDTKASTALVSGPAIRSQSLLVTSLPNTGTPEASGSLQPFLLMIASTGLLIAGGFGLRRRRT